MEVNYFEDGTPCWFELISTDLDAAASFYEKVLGWTVQSGAPEWGGDKMCMLGNQPVAGIVAQASNDASSQWTLYLRTSAIEATVAAVVDAGGSIARGPEEVRGLGRRAMVLDVTRAPVAVWEPGSFEGAGRVGEPGAYLWAELATASLDRSAAFFHQVFGLVVTEESAKSSDARQFAKGGHPIIGMVAHDVTTDVTTDVTDAWNLTFMVTDLEDTLVRAVAEGGFLGGPIVELAVGRHGTVTDPTGATFGLLEPGH
jgi:uncharacterized protein